MDPLWFPPQYYLCVAKRYDGECSPTTSCIKYRHARPQILPLPPPPARLLLGLLNGMVAASKTLVSEVCGKEHETVGMGVVTGESCRD